MLSLLKGTGEKLRPQNSRVKVLIQWEEGTR
jgi:hypothetical protein